MADGSAPMLRSGLCHGPDCPEEITEKSESLDFCTEGCQARWAAALVGAKPQEPLPFWSHIQGGWSIGAVAESVEALRLEIPQGLRSGDYVIIGDRHFIVAEHTPERTLYEPVGWLRRISRALLEVLPLALWALGLSASSWALAGWLGINGWLVATPVCITGGIFYGSLAKLTRRVGRRLLDAWLDLVDHLPIRRSWWKPNTWRRS